jgi:short-subunit dehydrogenase
MSQVSASDSKPWVLITGASSGIGEAFARRFAEEGWSLILVARSCDKLQALSDDLGRGAQGAKSLVIAADLTEKEAPRKIYNEVKRAGIELNALVNNAGVGEGNLFIKTSLERSLNMIDLNIRALVELTQLFLPQMAARKCGLILNVSSTASFQPMPYFSVYGAAKAFVTSFTEALWMETQGAGVRVLNLCPGVTKTNFGIAAGIRDFRQDPMAEEPEQVVDSAFKAFKKTCPTVISGWRNRLLVFLERFAPHRLLLWAVLQIQKHRYRR